ncbi:hypothetical protein AXG93_1160s1050 [Marchantia polymorpha subsp. ruderalis]|uniref:Uncharacterized protein n=1 Tax=Marchantia polymorpha subsp. ruderalis TaxID=1480154 RepID=A0A176VLA8_MARPO|nr:hypothetical protein AXG93_1160s1050 [Marchantia polymorpha subsp. ruderalis]
MYSYVCMFIKESSAPECALASALPPGPQKTEHTLRSTNPPSERPEPAASQRLWRCCRDGIAIRSRAVQSSNLDRSNLEGRVHSGGTSHYVGPFAFRRPIGAVHLEAASSGCGASGAPPSHSRNSPRAAGSPSALPVCPARPALATGLSRCESTVDSPFVAGTPGGGWTEATSSNEDTALPH